MNLELMKNLCSLKTENLYSILIKFLHNRGYKKIFRDSDYIFAEGSIPICLIAHMDTVFSYVPDRDDFFYDPEKSMLWYPYGSGFDDRAGIYAIMTMIDKGYHPHVIFTDKEEKGGIGARQLVTQYPRCPFKDCKMLIQLDRANEKDCVFYQCDNEDFTSLIESYGFEYNIGTFSDISVLAPDWKIAAVNLSIGYLDEHYTSERLMCEWCDATIERVEKILKDSFDLPYYKYIPKINYYTNHFSSLDDDGWDMWHCALCGKPILSYKDGKFCSDNGFNYCVCHECYNLYGMEETFSPSEDDEDDDIPFK